MGITLRNGVNEMGIKTVDKMGKDKMGSDHFFLFLCENICCRYS